MLLKKVVQKSYMYTIFNLKFVSNANIPAGLIFTSVPINITNKLHLFLAFLYFAKYI